MTKIAIPKKQKLNKEERVPVPYVKCSVCGCKTTSGLHQVRLKITEPARLVKNKVTGEMKRIPAKAIQKHFYMCTRCVEKGKPWPGKRP